MSEPTLITVEVTYAEPDQQWLWSMNLPLASTVRQAIAASGFSALSSSVAISDDNVGIFSRLVSLDTELEAGDRVEIYRPLVRDPKDTRRLRASHQRKAKPV